MGAQPLQVIRIAHQRPGALAARVDQEVDGAGGGQGDVITSAGVTAGIDMALHLVGERADPVKREIEWLAA